MPMGKPEEQELEFFSKTSLSSAFCLHVEYLALKLMLSNVRKKDRAASQVTVYSRHYPVPND